MLHNKSWCMHFWYCSCFIQNLSNVKFIEFSNRTQWEHGEDGTRIQFYCVYSIKLWMISIFPRCLPDKKARERERENEYRLTWENQEEYGSKGSQERWGGTERKKELTKPENRVVQSEFLKIGFQKFKFNLFKCNRHLCYYWNRNRPGTSKFPWYSELI